jgi:hypothetical protein
VRKEAPGEHRLLLTSLLESPRLSGGILAAGVAHLVLSTTPWQGWRCPFLQATGCPCPGCGLGRAVVLLLQGQFRESLHLHAFAGLAVTMLALLAASLLPGRLGEQVRAVVRFIEERTWLAAGALCAVLIYWLARFALDAAAFRTLVI